MPYLIIAALIALGVWQYRRYRSGMLTLPGEKPATPEQVVRAEIPPALQSAILDLIYNGRDPQSMHVMAGELEKYGFFDAAKILHKRAEELTILQGQVDAILIARGLNPSLVTPALREAIFQQIVKGTTVPSMPTPRVPETPAPSALDTAMQELRNEIGVLDTEYGALDRQIRTLTAPSPAFLRAWNEALVSWRSFVLLIERMTLQDFARFLPSTRDDLQLFRDVLVARRLDYARELGVQSSVPQAPPGPGAQAQIPPGTVPTRFVSRGIVLRNPELPLREVPDDSSRAIVFAPVGASITITDTFGDFYLVTYQGQRGWARKSDVSIAANPPATIPGGAIRRGIQ